MLSFAFIDTSRVRAQKCHFFTGQANLAEKEVRNFRGIQKKTSQKTNEPKIHFFSPKITEKVR